ncbi:MAG: hypothetical protein II060_14630 [Bacteroidales bacterium]|nr:hypothetical protein [Bacteroidales bacterium]
MKKIIIIGIFLSLIFANVSIAGGKYPPNGKKCEVAGKVIYVDKSCVTNLDWREMLWEFENNPEIFIGSVSGNYVDSIIWKRVYGEGRCGESVSKAHKPYQEMDNFPVVGFTLNQCKNYAVFRATAVMELFKYGKFKQYRDTKLEYFMLSSEQYVELLKQKWFAKSFTDGYAEITSDGKYVKGGKILDSINDEKVTFRLYAIIN